MSDALSFEVDGDRPDLLCQAANAMRQSPRDAAITLVEEGLRMREFPAVAFRDTAPCRQAYLRGARLPFWQIATVARSYDDDLPELSRPRFRYDGTKWRYSWKYDFMRGCTMAAQKTVRVQEKGQVTLPADVRRSLGIKKGDLVAVTQTNDGILITPQQTVATRTLDEIGAILREQGLTLEDLIESGREARSEILDERYGIAPPHDE